MGNIWTLIFLDDFKAFPVNVSYGNSREREREKKSFFLQLVADMGDFRMVK